nr:glycoside hydrolase [Sphingomonas jinjuensis]
MAPFYTQYVDARGVPITASSKVARATLKRARSIVLQMLERRPDIRRALVAMGARVAIMAQSEGTMDLPEQADWKKPKRDDPVLTVCERKHYDERIGRLSDRDYWNGRARGMGGLLTSGAEENLMAVPHTRYFGENIFVHEFSHEIMTGIERADPDLFRRIQNRYRVAKAAGLWKGEYAETTAEEYWAEGTQFWFNSNKLAVIDGQRILSDEDLRRYDPALYALLSEVYGDRHRLDGDTFWNHPARVPPGPPRQSTAEVC